MFRKSISNILLVLSVFCTVQTARAYISNQQRSSFPILKALTENRPIRIKLEGVKDFGYDWMRQPVNSRIDLNKQEETLKNWTIKAVRAWIAPTRMYHKFENFNDIIFVNSAPFDFVLYVQTQMDPPSNPTTAYNNACKARMRADNDTDCFESFYGERSMRLHYRTHNYNNLLHEMGHVFAMGDTYDLGTSYPHSVMKNSHFGDFRHVGLYADDTQGVLFNFCQQSKVCKNMIPNYSPTLPAHKFWGLLHDLFKNIEKVRYDKKLETWQADYLNALEQLQKHHLYATYKANWPNQDLVFYQLSTLSSADFETWVGCMNSNPLWSAEKCL